MEINYDNGEFTEEENIETEALEPEEEPGYNGEISEPGEIVEESFEEVENGDSAASSVGDYDARFDEIILLLEEQNEQIYFMQEMESQTIWTKPIEEYSPTEGILLIIMFMMLFVIIYELVGGIIICKK